VIRASSNRPNIFYIVRKADFYRGSLIKQATIEAKDAWIELGLFDYARDKIILYVRTRKNVEDLTDLLDYDTYTAESGTLVERKKILDR
jgi:superfamily II DNA helicase RecQ